MNACCHLSPAHVVPSTLCLYPHQSWKMRILCAVPQEKGQFFTEVKSGPSHLKCREGEQSSRLGPLHSYLSRLPAPQQGWSLWPLESLLGAPGSDPQFISSPISPTLTTQPHGAMCCSLNMHLLSVPLLLWFLCLGCPSPSSFSLCGELFYSSSQAEAQLTCSFWW